jgi:hypothetical protein
MNKRGMTRLSTKTTTLTVPETKVKVMPEVFVVHVTSSQEKLMFKDFKAAFKVWKEKGRKRMCDAALWRGPKWSKLYETSYYPEKLSQPYLPMGLYESYIKEQVS